MANRRMNAETSVNSYIFKQFQSICPSVDESLCSMKYLLKSEPIKPMQPSEPQIAYDTKTIKQPINTSLVFFSGFLELRTIDRLHVCRKQPAHRTPSSCGKLLLKSTSVRLLLAQSESFDLDVDPKLYDVFDNDLIPQQIIKIISMQTNMTPNEPIFMKILMSFLLQTIVTIVKINIAVQLDENHSQLGSSLYLTSFSSLPAHHTYIAKIIGYSTQFMVTKKQATAPRIRIAGAMSPAQ